MNTNKLKTIALIVTLSLLASCGPGELFETRLYGVRESEWSTLSSTERSRAISQYNEQQKIYAEQQRIADAARKEQEAYQRTLEAQRLRETQLLEQETNRIQHQAMLNEQQRVSRQSALNNQRDSEQRAMDEARRRSMQTYAQEQARVGDLAEQRAIDEAKRRSMQTYSQEQARKAANVSAEQRAVEEAQRRSLQTYNQEQARRAANASAEQRAIEDAKRASLQTYAQEQARINSPAPSPSISNWRLNEGHLVEGGKLVMDLQREMGRTPNRSETKSRLASRMHISHNQADEIIEELGLF
ncbi:MAG: hypothetical protein HON32_05165 [Francisellaceae bacterium]|jgi:hypothetical protein|nr:hypothetical protein [Francisellaceae bacterium]MBT6538334.1 hypothetical protein [Francisellaceae bacterium]